MYTIDRYRCKPTGLAVSQIRIILGLLNSVPYHATNPSSKKINIIGLGNFHCLKIVKKNLFLNKC